VGRKIVGPLISKLCLLALGSFPEFSVTLSDLKKQGLGFIGGFPLEVLRFPPADVVHEVVAVDKVGRLLVALEPRRELEIPQSLSSESWRWLYHNRLFKVVIPCRQNASV
jgi:hypothetical protein